MSKTSPEEHMPRNSIRVWKVCISRFWYDFCLMFINRFLKFVVDAVHHSWVGRSVICCDCPYRLQKGSMHVLDGRYQMLSQSLSSMRIHDTNKCNNYRLHVPVTIDVVHRNYHITFFCSRSPHVGCNSTSSTCDVFEQLLPGDVLLFLPAVDDSRAKGGPSWQMVLATKDITEFLELCMLHY